MAEGEATGSEFKARAGTLTLLFIAGSTDRELLLELLEDALGGGHLGPMGDPPEETEEERAAYYEEKLAAEEEELEGEELGEDPDVPMLVSSKGEEFLFVADTLKGWLGNRPEGPLQLGPRAGEAIAALVCCWSATVIHALAREPLTLTELERFVGILDHETLEEHVAAMERTGQVEVRRSAEETRYALTDWLREGISPIIAAVRLERHYPEDDTAPPDILDVEAAFQLALPLLRLPPELRGRCRLGVQMPDDPQLMAGAEVEIDRGLVISSSPLLDEAPGNWLTGSPLDWCDTVVDPASERLECGGDRLLAAALIEALHEALFSDVVD